MIDGNSDRTIYRVEYRRDGEDWKFYINSNEPLDFLLDKYRDNGIIEYRVKAFKFVK